MEKEDVNLVAILLAIFIPPLGVLIKRGLGLQLIINLLLTLFGYIPGVIHALYIILRKNEKT
jgi:uncharacterized membrane protein YqaE (UPF0057 family)